MGSSNVEELASGLGNMGLALKRKSFRDQPKAVPQVVPSKSVTQEKPKAKKKVEIAEEYHRISHYIDDELLGELSSLAIRLHHQSDKEKRETKINRDMVMRSLLSTVFEIDWDDAFGKVHTEAEIKNYVFKKLGIKKEKSVKE